MCDCPEIQGFKTTTGLIHGDYYHNREYSPEHVDIFVDQKRRLVGEIIYGFIWLPRQEDLQKMVGDTPFYNIKNAMFSVLDDFRNFAFTTNFRESIPLTMEQLWLAFYMSEKYDKVWDEEKWVLDVLQDR